MGTYYPQEFKDRLVELYRGGRTFMELAREFNVSATSIATWARAMEKRQGRQRGGGEAEAIESDRDKIARLERELARKTEELEILGKALAFFVRQTDQ